MTASAKESKLTMLPFLAARRAIVTVNIIYPFEVSPTHGVAALSVPAPRLCHH
jgi:hypothetical protein